MTSIPAIRPPLHAPSAAPEFARLPTDVHLAVLQHLSVVDTVHMLTVFSKANPSRRPLIEALKMADPLLGHAVSLARHQSVRMLSAVNVSRHTGRKLIDHDPNELEVWLAHEQNFHFMLRHSCNDRALLVYLLHRLGSLPPGRPMAAAGDALAGHLETIRELLVTAIQPRMRAHIRLAQIADDPEALRQKAWSVGMYVHEPDREAMFLALRETAAYDPMIVKELISSVGIVPERSLRNFEFRELLRLADNGDFAVNDRITMYERLVKNLEHVSDPQLFDRSFVKLWARLSNPNHPRSMTELAEQSGRISDSVLRHTVRKRILEAEPVDHLAVFEAVAQTLDHRTSQHQYLIERSLVLPQAHRSRVIRAALIRSTAHVRHPELRRRERLALAQAAAGSETHLERLARSGIELRKSDATPPVGAWLQEERELLRRGIGVLRGKGILAKRAMIDTLTIVPPDDRAAEITSLCSICAKTPELLASLIHHTAEVPLTADRARLRLHIFELSGGHEDIASALMQTSAAIDDAALRYCERAAIRKYARDNPAYREREIILELASSTEDLLTIEHRMEERRELLEMHPDDSDVVQAVFEAIRKSPEKEERVATAALIRRTASRQVASYHDLETLDGTLPA